MEKMVPPPLKTRQQEWVKRRTIASGAIAHAHGMLTGEITNGQRGQRPGGDPAHALARAVETADREEGMVMTAGAHAVDRAHRAVTMITKITGRIAKERVAVSPNRAQQNNLKKSHHNRENQIQLTVPKVIEMEENQILMTSSLQKTHHIIHLEKRKRPKKNLPKLSREMAKNPVEIRLLPAQ